MLKAILTLGILLAGFSAEGTTAGDCEGAFAGRSLTLEQTEALGRIRAQVATNSSAEAHLGLFAMAAQFGVVGFANAPDFEAYDFARLIYRGYPLAMDVADAAERFERMQRDLRELGIELTKVQREEILRNLQAVKAKPTNFNAAEVLHKIGAGHPPPEVIAPQFKGQAPVFGRYRSYSTREEAIALLKESVSASQS